MLFNSYEFIFLLLPVSFGVYFYLNSRKKVVAAKYSLVFSSLFFYSWWNIIYLPLILLSILVNFNIARLMQSNNKSIHITNKNLLFIGLFFNLGLLIYFKYMDFFIFNTNFLFGTEFEFLKLALPLAISFFTLQQIAFIVDCYEGLVKERNFIDYTIFVTFFPQLIAGPIVHHKEMMPQFASLKNKFINVRNITLGLFIFSIGLFKKVILAETFATWANEGFSSTEPLNFFESWITSLAYTFQLYFDFSGYADMAIGAALLFNIVIPINFNSPFKSTGMIEFWQRWHITLSQFIGTYLYSSILKSFKKFTFENAMFVTVITITIIGFWHGASWMFVLYGFVHGLGIVINHYWKKTKIKMNKYLAWLITFIFINLTFVIFRAENFDQIFNIYSGMIGLHGINLPEFLAPHMSYLSSYGILFGDFLTNINGNRDTIVWIIIGFIIVLFCKNSNELKDGFKPSFLWAGFIGLIFYISVISLTEVTEFIYFNF